MVRSRIFTAVPFVLLATACANEPEVSAGSRERVSRVEQRIVNGVPSTSADDHVVKISIGNGGLCTGTLLTPNLVLTARHCVSNMNENTECGTFTSNLAPSSLAISIGAKGTQIVARGTRIWSEPGTSGCGNDIALFQLDRDLTTARTAKVRLSKLSIGEAASTVGFGESGNGQLTPGRYAKKGLAIDAVGPSSYTFKTKTNQSIPVSVPAGEIVTGESTCFGDSGGPLFDAAGNVIGVTSRGVDESCVDRPSIYSDTASHATLIRNAATTAGHPLQEAAGPPPGTEDPPSPGPKTTDPAPDEDDDTESSPPGKGRGTTPSAGEEDEESEAPRSGRTTIASSGCSISHAGGSQTAPLATFAVVAVLLAVARIGRTARRSRVRRASAALTGGCRRGHDSIGPRWPTTPPTRSPRRCGSPRRRRDPSIRCCRSSPT